MGPRAGLEVLETREKCRRAVGNPTADRPARSLVTIPPTLPLLPNELQINKQNSLTQMAAMLPHRSFNPIVSRKVFAPPLN